MEAMQWTVVLVALLAVVAFATDVKEGAEASGKADVSPMAAATSPGMAAALPGVPNPFLGGAKSLPLNDKNTLINGVSPLANAELSGLQQAGRAALGAAHLGLGSGLGSTGTVGVGVGWGNGGHSGLSGQEFRNHGTNTFNGGLQANAMKYMASNPYLYGGVNPLMYGAAVNPLAMSMANPLAYGANPMMNMNRQAYLINAINSGILKAMDYRHPNPMAANPLLNMKPMLNPAVAHLAQPGLTTLGVQQLPPHMTSQRLEEQALAMGKNFPSLRTPHNLSPDMDGLKPGFFLLNQGRLLGGTKKIDMPSLKLSLLKDGTIVGEVEGVYDSGRHKIEGTWMKQKGSWTINFMRIYRGQKISMTGAITKGRPLLSGAFRTEDGTGHGKFQYYVNRLKFHPGMELANGGYLPGKMLPGVLVRGRYKLEGLQINLQTKRSSKSPKVIIDLKKGGKLTGTARYTTSANGQKHVRKIRGSWTPTGITFTELIQGVKFKYRGVMKHGQNSMAGIYTSAHGRTGTFKYSVEPKVVKGRFNGHLLKVGRYFFKGTTINYLSQSKRKSADVKLTLYEDGKLAGYAEYRGTADNSVPTIIRTVTGAWNPYSLVYREAHGTKKFEYIGAMVNKDEMEGTYTYAVSADAPILRGTFKMNGEYVGPILDQFLPRGLLAQGEYIISGSTVNLATRQEKVSPTTKVTLKAGGVLEGIAMHGMTSHKIKGKWTPAFMTYTDGAYTYRGAMKIGHNVWVGTYGPTAQLGARVNQGEFQMKVRPINVKKQVRSGYIQAGEYLLRGKMTGVYSGRSAKAPKIKVLLDRDGTCKGFAEYPATKNTAAWIKVLKNGYWSTNWIKWTEEGESKMFYEGVMVGDGRFYGHYDKSFRNGAKFLEGHFNLEIEYLGPGPKKHPGEPADILVEGEYIATGQTQRGANKAQSALVKLVLGPDGVLTGFAQYTRHRVTRPISGSWTPTFISYTEQGTGYTFKGNMKLGEEYKMDGVYYGNGVAGGKFKYTLEQLRVDPRKKGPRALLRPGSYTLKGETKNTHTNAKKDAPVMKITLEPKGVLDGIAEYGKVAGHAEEVNRELTGKWDQRTMEWTERVGAIKYTYKGVMTGPKDLTGTYWVKGGQYAVETQLGTFHFKVHSDGPPLPIIPGALPYGPPPSMFGKLGMGMSPEMAAMSGIEQPVDRLGLPNLKVVQTLETQPGNELTPGLYRVIRGTENNDHSGSVKTDPDYLFRFNKDHTIIGRYLDRRNNQMVPLHGKWTAHGLEFNRKSKGKIGVNYRFIGALKGALGRLIGTKEILLPGKKEGEKAGYFLFHLRSMKVIGMKSNPWAPDSAQALGGDPTKNLLDHASMMAADLFDPSLSAKTGFNPTLLAQEMHDHALTGLALRNPLAYMQFRNPMNPDHLNGVANGMGNTGTTAYNGYGVPMNPYQQMLMRGMRR